MHFRLGNPLDSRSENAFQVRKFSEVSVEVKKSQHKYIIGPRGNSINEILDETGVFVEMPQMDNPSETITLRGPQEKLGLGKLTFLAEYLHNRPNDENILLMLQFLLP